MENLPPPQEKKLPAPHEKLLRSPTFWERQEKIAKWLAICSILFFLILLFSVLLLRSQKSTITPVQPTRTSAPASTTLNNIGISSDAKSILNAQTKKVIFTITDTQKYLKDNRYYYNPDTFQTSDAKYTGDCFLDASLSNKKDRIIFSAGCLPGDLPQPWIGIYNIPNLPPNAGAYPNPVVSIKFLTSGNGENFAWSKDDTAVTYEADLGLSGQTETRAIDSNTGQILEKNRISVTPNPKTENYKIYRNEKLGFELTFPNKDWYLPSSNDIDPHFYATRECANSERPKCSALEIQNHDNDSEISKGWEARFNTLKTEGRSPTKLSLLLPEAIVIKSNAPGPAAGWSIQYDIFFQTDKRNFLIFSNNEALEKDILPTFKSN